MRGVRSAFGVNLLVVLCYASTAADEPEYVPAISRISGVVLDPTGDPLAGAQVELETLAETPTSSWTTHPVTTDERGEFAFEELLEGRYQVTVHHTQWCGQRLPPVDLDPHRPAPSLRVKLGPGVAAQGSVTVLRDGKIVPVAGIRVDAWRQYRGDAEQAPGPIRRHATAHTNASGEFTLEHLAPGDVFRVRAQKYQWRSADAELHPNAPDVLGLQMPPEGVLQGVVRNADGNAVGGARVRVLSEHAGFGDRRMVTSRHGDPPHEAATDAAGHFRLGALDAAKSYYLLITANGFAPLSTGMLPASMGERTTFDLSPGAILRARVVTKDGQPAPGLKLSVRPLDRRQSGDLAWAVVTDRDGVATLQHLADGGYVVGGQREGRSPLVIVPEKHLVRHGEDALITITAVEPATVRGLVQDEGGRPLAGAELRFHTEHALRSFTDFAQTKSDQQGRFAIHGLFPGTVRGSATLKGYVPPDNSPVRRFAGHWPDRYPVNLVLRAGELQEDLVVRLRRDPAQQVIETVGTVVDPEGKPVAGAQVYRYSETGSYNGRPSYAVRESVRTDEHGNYRFYCKRGYALGVVVLPTPQHPFYGTAPLESRELKLEQCGSLAGQIVDQQGEALAQVSVHLRADQPFVASSAGTRTYTSTDEQGRFTFPFVRAGNCGLRYSLPGYEGGSPPAHALSTKIAAGKNTALPTLRLRKVVTQEFRGRLVDQHGKPLVGWRAGGQRTGPDGMFQYSLKPGEKNRQGFRFERGKYESGLRIGYTSGVLNFPESTPAEVQDFVVSTGGRVTGRIRIVETGASPKVLTAVLEIDYKKRQTPRQFGECCVTSTRATRDDLLRRDGSFEFRDLAEGHYVLTVRGEEISETKVPVHVDAAMHAQLGEISIPRARVVKGQLQAPDEQKPLNGARYHVSVEGRRKTGSRMARPSIRLADDGQFVVGQLPPDVQQLTLLLTEKKENTPWQPSAQFDRAVVTGKLNFGDATTLDLGAVNARAYRLVGRAINARTGMPLSRASLADVQFTAIGKKVFTRYWHGHNMEIDDNGRFTLPHVRPDFDSIAAKIPGYLPLTIEQPPRDATKDDVALGDLKFDPGLRLRGLLRGPNGERAVGGEIQVTASGHWIGRVVTDQRGRFDITGLTPGDVQVTATLNAAGDKNPWLKPTPEGAGQLQLKRGGIEIAKDRPNFVQLRFTTTQAE